MRAYQAPTERFFRLPNRIFDVPLDATQFKLYAYLICCSGSKGYCWPSLGTIMRDTGIKKSSLQKALKLLQQRQLIAVYPCHAVALPKVEHKEMHTIPAAPLQAFLNEAKASGVYEMYYIELATGLRRGELLGLKWEDIDLAAGIIRVHRQVARVNGEIVEAPLKTKNSYRVVSISPQATEVLKSQGAKTNDEYVFPSPNGGPISPDSVNNMLKRVLERAGIPKVRFHDLRHTFATLALQNGVDIKTVSGMLGHFSAGFTLDTYAHVTTAAQKEAAEIMGGVLKI